MKWRTYARQNDLLPLVAQALEMLVEIRLREAAGVVLGDGVFARFGGQFGEFFRQRRLGREDRGAVGGGVHDVHDLAGLGFCAVFVQELGVRDGGLVVVRERKRRDDLGVPSPLKLGSFLSGGSKGLVS